MKEWPFPSWMHTPVAPAVWQMHQRLTHRTMHTNISATQCNFKADAHHSSLCYLCCPSLAPYILARIILKDSYHPVWKVWFGTIYPQLCRRWNKKNLPRLEKKIEVHKWVHNWSNVLEWNGLWCLSLHLILIPFSNTVSFTETQRLKFVKIFVCSTCCLRQTCCHTCIRSLKEDILALTSLIQVTLLWHTLHWMCLLRLLA